MYLKKSRKQLITLILISIVFISLNSTNVNAGSGGAYNAKSTAYSLSQYKPDGTLRRTHSGKLPSWGMVAVEYNYYPFGTIITTATTISHPNFGGRKTFTVEDSGSGLSGPHLDFWWGYCTTCAKGGDIDNFDRAINYGEQYIDFTYVTP